MWGDLDNDHVADTLLHLLHVITRQTGLTPCEGRQHRRQRRTSIITQSSSYVALAVRMFDVVT